MTLTTITTYFTAIPPVVIVILLGFAYIRLMDGRLSLASALDLGLAALYLWQPRMLAWCLFLVALRNVPTFAAIVARLGGLDRWDGWSIHAALFLLPGLRTFATTASSPPEATSATLPPAVGPTVALSSPPAKQPLRAAQWLGAVNDDLTAPHLGVVGPTRLGKTTFVLAALGRRAGRQVITTPKSSDVDPWSGAAAHRLRFDLDARAVDWQPIAGAISGVHFEMLQRNATNRAKDAEPITLVIDELSTTLANCDKATRQQVLELLNMGAGAGIRLVLIDPEINVKAWGIEGRGDIRGNLIFARVEDGRRWLLGRLDQAGRMADPAPLDTAEVVLLAEQAGLAGREWVGVCLSPLGADSAQQTQTNGTHTAVNGTNDAEERIKKYMMWREAGIKKEQGRAIRQAEGAGIDDREWAEAGRRIGEKQP